MMTAWVLIIATYSGGLIAIDVPTRHRCEAVAAEIRQQAASDGRSGLTWHACVHARTYP